MMGLITTHAGMYNTNPDRRKYFKGKGKKMPFESKAQQKFMFAKHPKIAKRWAKETSNIKGLPEKKKNMPGMSVHPEVNCAQQGRKQTMSIKDMGM